MFHKRTLVVAVAVAVGVTTTAQGAGQATPHAELAAGTPTAVAELLRDAQPLMLPTNGSATPNQNLQPQPGVQLTKGTQVGVRCAYSGEAVAGDVTWYRLDEPQPSQTDPLGYYAILPGAWVELTNVPPYCPDQMLPVPGSDEKRSQAEIDACLRRIDVCAWVGYAAKWATDNDEYVAKTAGKNLTGVDDAADAARHCLLVGTLTAVGTDVAEMWSQAHEADPGSARSHAMDSHNNNVTRKAIAAALTGQDGETAESATYITDEQRQQLSEDAIIVLDKCIKLVRDADERPPYEAPSAYQTWLDGRLVYFGDPQLTPARH
jgi:hypothetical protein